MTLEKEIGKLFNLKDNNWLKHANPWSVWTRFATLPFLILAIWSRIWLNWYCLIPISIIIIWLFINPTLFKKPKTFNSWASKAVIGEKYWANRNNNIIPNHHKTPIFILTLLQSIGGILLTIGLWKLNVNITIIGTIIIYLTKMWFLDRMVWIFNERNITNTEYIHKPN